MTGCIRQLLQYMPLGVWWHLHTGSSTAAAGWEMGQGILGILNSVKVVAPLPICTSLPMMLQGSQLGCHSCPGVPSCSISLLPLFACPACPPAPSCWKGCLSLWFLEYCVQEPNLFCLLTTVQFRPCLPLHRPKQRRTEQQARACLQTKLVESEGQVSKLSSEVEALRSENARLQNRNGILEKVLELKEGKEGQPRQPAPQAGQPALLCTCIPGQQVCVQHQ